MNVSLKFPLFLSLVLKHLEIFFEVPSSNIFQSFLFRYSKFLLRVFKGVGKFRKFRLKINNLFCLNKYFYLVG